MTSEQDPSSPTPLPVILNNLSFEALPDQENRINTTTFMKHQNERSFEAQNLRNAFRLQRSLTPSSNKGSKSSQDNTVNHDSPIQTEVYLKNQQFSPDSAAKETAASPSTCGIDTAKILSYEKKPFDPFGEQLAHHFSVSDPSNSLDRLNFLHGTGHIDRHGRTASIGFQIPPESDCLLTKYSSNSTKAEDLVSRRNFATISEIDPREENKTEENELMVKRNIRPAPLAAIVDDEREQPISLRETQNLDVPRNPTQPQAASEVQNPNQININIQEPPAEAQPQESVQNQQTNPKLESNIYYRRITIMFLLAAIGSIMLVFALKELVHYRALLVLSYCYWIYVIADCLKSAYSRDRDRWRRKEDVFKALDAACVIVAEVWIDLKVSGYVANCAFACLPFFMMAIVYCCTTKAPDNVSPITSLIKFLYTFQTLLVTLRIDEVITWDWRPVLLLGWIFLGIVGLYCIAYGFLLVMLLILVLFGQHNIPPRRVVINFIGLLWHFLYYGMGIIGIVYLLGAWQALNGDFNLLTTIGWTTLYYGFILSLYTIICSHHLKEFSEYVSRSALFFESNNNNNNNNMELPIVNRKPVYKLRYQVKKRTNHFLMVSSTYFMPLTLKTLMGGKQRLEKTKEIIMNLSNKGRKLQTENTKLVGKKDLQGFKETMDRKFVKLDLENPTEIVKQIDHNVLRISEARGQSEGLFPHNQTVSSPAHISFVSEGNITDYKEDDVFKAKERINDGEAQCIICFQNPANAISMRCGHGGFCYDCAIQAIRKKNVCVECREPIREIYKVNPQPKVGNIVQSYEVTRFAKVPIKITQ